MRISSIKPEVISLRELFKEEAVSLRIPSIQRQFVWDPEDIKELVDSIANGYPIGAIIIWEPAGRFPSAPLIGEDNTRSARYILDGQQRLTALMLVKNHWQLMRGVKKILRTPISYVPENKRLYLSSKKGIDVSLIVNASLGDADCLDKLHKDYPATYKQAMEFIGDRIVNYKLPFYVLKSDATGASDDTYEKIAEIFTRVNSAGVKIGNLEMFLSFFAAAFPEAEKDRIIRLHERLSADFELDLEPLVRFIFSRMKLSQNQITKVAAFKKAIHELKSNYARGKYRIRNIINSAEGAIDAVTGLLIEEFGISTTQYIPSQNVLLPLFDYAFERGCKCVKDIARTDRKTMLRWFITASFNGIYSSSPNNKIEEDLAIIRRGSKRFPICHLISAMNQRPPHRGTMRRADFLKNAYNSVLRGRTGKEYLMLLAVLLFRNRATDWAGRPVRGDNATVHHIFPREYLKENDETREDMINSLANLTFICQSVNSEIGDRAPEAYLSEYADVDLLHTHMIPARKKLWGYNSFKEFLDARVNLIWRHTKRLLKELE